MSSMHLRVPRTAVVLAVALLLGTGASAQGVYDAIDSDFSSTLNSVNSFLCSVDTAHGKENSVKCRPPPPGSPSPLPPTSSPPPPSSSSSPPPPPVTAASPPPPPPKGPSPPPPSGPSPAPCPACPPGQPPILPPVLPPVPVPSPQADTSPSPALPPQAPPPQAPPPAEQPLYAFTSLTFTSAGAMNPAGPSLTQLRTAYRPSQGAWVDDSAFLNMVTNGVQIWTVPRTATYTFQIAGGQGGTSFRYRNVGGSGDSFTVAVRLPISTKVYLVVGQTAVEAPSASSGGGASLVWVAPGSQAPVLLAVAGGGGAGAPSGAGGNGGTFSTGTPSPGVGGVGNSPYAPGGSGQPGKGGKGGDFSGGGGGGCAADPTAAYLGGAAVYTGSDYTPAGGFGMGGSGGSSYDQYGGGGGGGGFIGGNGGDSSYDIGAPGAGGTSYINPSYILSLPAGVPNSNGDGFVTVTAA